MSKSILVLFSIILIISSCSQKNNEVKPEIRKDFVIYIAEDFSGEAIWKTAIPDFEKLFQCNVTFRKFDSSLIMLQTAGNEKDSTRIDVLLNLDNTLLTQALEESIFVNYKSGKMQNIIPKHHFDKTYSLIPYNYTHLSIIYDSRKISEPPTSFGEIQDGKWENQFIMVDPEFSSIGRAMLLWTVAAFDKFGYSHFWKSMKKNIHTITNNLEDAYDLFLKEEAPFVLGFTTLPNYQRSNHNRYKAGIMLEGGFCFYEAVAIMKSSPDTTLSKQFVDYLLSSDFQKQLPILKNKYPVMKDVEIPFYYNSIPKPDKILNDNLDQDIVRDYLKSWIKRWQKILLKK